MNLKCQASVLDNLLRICYTRQHRFCEFQKRTYAAVPVPSKTTHEIKDVAILGGGITGLASAYYLSNVLPKIKITLYESAPRLGGWLRSTSVDVGSGKVVFEQGPRNLRPSVPNGMVTLELVSSSAASNDELLI